MFFSCLSLSYLANDQPLWEGLGVSLGPGSLLVIRGKNGCGKTTLLDIIAGIREPEQGMIEWSSEDHPACCYIRHELAIKPSLTVEENLRDWAALTTSEELILPALTYFGLMEKSGHFAKTLSAGWKKRLALARLLACDCPVWLLDEPEVHLDKDAIKRLEEAIRAKLGQGGIIFIVSHQLQFDFPHSQLDLEDFCP